MVVQSRWPTSPWPCKRPTPRAPALQTPHCGTSMASKCRLQVGTSLAQLPCAHKAAHMPDCAGLYNGAILPPLIYVSGQGGVTSNRSLTLSNVLIQYETCSKEVWDPVVTFLARLPTVGPACRACLACELPV